MNSRPVVELTSIVAGLVEAGTNVPVTAFVAPSMVTIRPSLYRLTYTLPVAWLTALDSGGPPTSMLALTRGAAPAGGGKAATSAAAGRRRPSRDRDIRANLPLGNARVYPLGWVTFFLLRSASGGPSGPAVGAPAAR